MTSPSLQNILEIIRSLAESERIIARFYRCCAETWKALILARDIESAIIEKTYHEIVRTANLAYLSLVKQVVTETQFHKNAIEKRFRECIT
jgi:hypothetical protein